MVKKFQDLRLLRHTLVCSRAGPYHPHFRTNVNLHWSRRVPVGSLYAVSPCDGPLDEKCPTTVDETLSPSPSTTQSQVREFRSEEGPVRETAERLRVRRGSVRRRPTVRLGGPLCESDPQGPTPPVAGPFLACPHSYVPRPSNLLVHPFTLIGPGSPFCPVTTPGSGIVDNGDLRVVG